MNPASKLRKILAMNVSIKQWILLQDFLQKGRLKDSGVEQPDLDYCEEFLAKTYCVISYPETQHPNKPSDFMRYDDQMMALLGVGNFNTRISSNRFTHQVALYEVVGSDVRSHVPVQTLEAREKQKARESQLKPTNVYEGDWDRVMEQRHLSRISQ